ncbi:imidazole glycerol phosphate synthase subunit HisH [OCS116 cluster bacterium]|nr:imidazole glycerol phosphate synthase subunit HisH [OCS116 cluster bacterium]
MRNINIAIINYECGNIHSARKAFELALNELNISGSVTVTNEPEIIFKADKIVLPGVGAFAECFSKLISKKGLKDSISERVHDHGIPILGICVGLQLMADKGFENIESKGLGWVSGSVENLYPDDKNLKIPHMGWNEVNFKRDDGNFSDLNGEDFYFVHSYYFNVKNTDNILATTNYNQPFPSALIKKNIIGTQFHPEKSQRSGVEFIKRFLMWKP